MATMPARNVFEGARVTRPRVLEAELDAPWCVVVEASDDTYLYVVRRGSCLLDSDGLDAPLCLRAGDIVTLVAGQRHVWRDGPATAPRPTLSGFSQAVLAPGGGVKGTGTGRTRLLVLSSPRDSNAFVPVYPPLVVVPRSERQSASFLQRVVQLVEIEHAGARPGKEAVIRRLSELLVIELVRFALPRLPRGGRNWLGGLADPQVGRAISLMHADLARAWTLSDLAAAVGMSRAAFVERFTRLVGEPPNRHLRRVRMDRAAIELEQSDEAIVSIADAVGYASESAFNKAFVREIGMAPARYRRARRSRAS
jgi:AraC-like DNA-binding protein